jgi:DNA-directed RNA polymerase specialized sigma24 family protein
MDERLDVLISRVERLTKLIAAGLVLGKTQGEQVDLLSKAGFQPKEIAGLVGSTPNSVRVTLSTMRKAKSKKFAKKAEKGE